MRAAASAIVSKAPPKRNAAGMRTRCVWPRSMRTACGMTRPTKPMIPDTATHAAVNSDADTKKQLDKLLGKGHGFDVGLNKKGNVVVIHPEVEEAAEQDDKVDSTKLPTEVKGDKMWDLASTMVGMMDMYSGLLIQAGKALSGVLGKAIGNLKDALEDWQK